MQDGVPWTNCMNVKDKGSVRVFCTLIGVGVGVGTIVCLLSPSRDAASALWPPELGLTSPHIMDLLRRHPVW